MKGVRQARRALHAALVPLLNEGRVQPYADGTPVPPWISIGSPRLSRRTESNNNTFTVATFPVVIRVDGSTTAQLEQLDDLVVEVWQRASALPGRWCRAVASTPSTADLAGTGSGSTQTQTVDVEIGVEPISWCPAAPECEEES